MNNPQNQRSSARPFFLIRLIKRWARKEPRNTRGPGQAHAPAPSSPGPRPQPRLQVPAPAGPAPSFPSPQRYSQASSPWLFNASMSHLPQNAHPAPPQSQYDELGFATAPAPESQRHNRGSGSQRQASQASQASEYYELPDEINLTGQVRTSSGVYSETNYSDIYKGEWRGCEVAVKRIRNPGRAALHTIRRHFLREVVLWCNLKHAYILPLYGFVNDGHSFGLLISPWCRHGDLSNWLRNGRLSLELRVQQLLQVMIAVEYLHSMDIVHGDLKPSNILMKDNYDAQLCDFGLSRLISNLRTGLTSTNNHQGTPRYCAPEIVDADSPDTIQPSKATDIYALGCLAFEFIYQNAPLSHIDGHDSRIIYRALSKGEPPAKRPDGPLLGPWNALWNLMERCWSRDPNLRPKANQVRATLERLRPELR